MNEKHPDFITTYHSIGGWKAVQMSWEQMDADFGMYTPWQTGFGGYKNREMAVREAKNWAEAEEIEYKEGGL